MDTRSRGDVAEAAVLHRPHRRRTDVFAVHVHATGDQFIVPVEDGKASKMYLRLERTRNNQQAHVRWARDFLLADRVARRAGAPSPALTPAA